MPFTICSYRRFPLQCDVTHVGPIGDVHDKNIAHAGISAWSNVWFCL